MLEDLKLFAMAQKTMDWLAKRQEVLAQNIANANTPKYQPSDLAPLDFKNLLEPERQPVRAFRRGRGRSSPLQFGQRPLMRSEQSAQNVHS